MVTGYYVCCDLLRSDGIRVEYTPYSVVLDGGSAGGVERIEEHDKE